MKHLMHTLNIIFIVKTNFSFVILINPSEYEIFKFTISSFYVSVILIFNIYIKKMSSKAFSKLWHSFVKYNCVCFFKLNQT